MSIYDRDYIREDRSPQSDFRPGSWSALVWLLVINGAVYLGNNLLFYSPDRDLFGLSIQALKSFRIWTPITYQFVHATPWHLLGNMVGLYFLGKMLMTLTSPRQLVRIYLLGGLAGGALQLAWNAAFGPDAVIIGASASVLAIVIAVATLIPYQRITMLLFFVIPVSLTMKQVALVIIGFNVVSLLFDFGSSAENGIAVMAHFGGIFFGWCYIHYRLHLEKASPSRARPSKPAKSRFGIRLIRDREEGDAAEVREAGGQKKPFVSSDVDAILDKINEQGFQSLTEAERDTLKQSSRKLSDRIDRNP
ncbi:MAG: rhomboid family intramembrane serine protease [Verrucomicrobiales bacterium]|nr:rhomboid family intramembrane serine protease [Verrucomicrobiales bacterium]MBP9223842.1 rhomboid family intramembrane serine protease [Verrucomicrobiales bacterium]